MLTSIQQLLNVYQPDSANVYNHNPWNKYSEEQCLQAKSYAQESWQTLKELSASPANKLEVKKILITCCEVIEILSRVPSIAKPNEVIDMSDVVCDTMRDLADHMNDYDIDPSNVTKPMIKRHCEKILAHE
jgi:hypothetical protein